MFEISKIAWWGKRWEGVHFALFSSFLSVFLIYYLFQQNGADGKYQVLCNNYANQLVRFLRASKDDKGPFCPSFKYLVSV